MADHWRKQVRDALKTKLAAMVTVPAARVFTEDEYPREDGKFPGVNLTVGDTQRRRIGTVNVAGEQRIEVENIAVVIVEIAVRQATGARDTLDQIAKEVEQAWLPTPVDRGLGVTGCRDAELVAFGDVLFDNDAEQLTALMRVQFQVKVRSWEGRPDQT